MIVDEEQEIGSQGMSLEVVWRNPLPRVGALLRTREENNPYCRLAEQASKIRVRRSNWDTNTIGLNECRKTDRPANQPRGAAC
jgi:hypothetical protein